MNEHPATDSDPRAPYNEKPEQEISGELDLNDGCLWVEWFATGWPGNWSVYLDKVSLSIDGEQCELLGLSDAVEQRIIQAVQAEVQRRHG